MGPPLRISEEGPPAAWEPPQGRVAPPSPGDPSFSQLARGPLSTDADGDNSILLVIVSWLPECISCLFRVDRRL